ncbi:hypothetical protein TVAG_016580 [Trichomonas vaginalis G3]|uniref:Regulator of chromosome condensation family protein n=1 Tax=Trichomonas vaginalis (strain ATCC PRA-98 / G3) TaxID=412133 RepID=A2EQZ6_TRIV3|nr:ubiquitin-protein transferase protein [Trichomonas vaginalis G3]EAY04886.1 hypothetical protein TVAG_016580 [Trichomonas vaginalis G3]KAI5519456.1 ubiquitin-protein transferase protein [Trichomonas vaginalis G3]|eukprot:XP_001317109.1 hypothetical protein [Trichomonas vaginalis G3]
MKNSLSVAACGSSQFGQSTHTSDISIPHEFVVPSIDDIRVGGWHSCVLCSTENCAFWGSNLDQQIPKVQSNLLRSPTSYQIPLDFKDVALGSKHTVILTKSNVLQSFGSNAQLQLPPNSTSKIKSVFAKFDQTAAISDDNKVLVWGNNAKQMKITLPNTEIPAFVELAPFGIFILSDKLVCYHYVAGQVKCQFPNVISVAASRTKAMILKNDGRIYQIVQDKLIQIVGIPDIPIKIFAGGAHYGCVTISGKCYTWGCGTRGQLGNGQFSNQAKPTLAIFDDKKCVIEAFGGEEHSVFLLCTNDVFIPAIHPAMKEQPLPSAVIADSIRYNTYNPPQFDIKF